MTQIQYIEFLKKQARKAGGVQELARELKVTASYLYNVFSGKQDVGPKLLYPYNYKKTVTKTVDIRKAATEERQAS